jgi:hypothetical protein
MFGSEKTMTAAQLEEHDATIEEVFAWRLEQLLRAGYGRRDAGQLAARKDIDLHLAVDLLRTGCPTELAVSILS